jgi:hypothetical protein
MAEAPTAEDAARRILEVLRESDTRARAYFMRSATERAFAQGAWRAADWQAGLTYAVAAGWLTIHSETMLRLTDEGYEEM